VKVPRNWSSDAVKFGGRMGWLGGRICTLIFWFLVRKKTGCRMEWLGGRIVMTANNTNVFLGQICYNFMRVTFTINIGFVSE